MKKTDIALILGCLALALVLFLWFGGRAGGGATAIVERDGVEWRRISLARQKGEEILDLGGGYHVRLRVAPGEISFLSSDCPDQICVRAGKLTAPGQIAVCLPARVSVRLESEGAGYDGYTG